MRVGVGVRCELVELYMYASTTAALNTDSVVRTVCSYGASTVNIQYPRSLQYVVCYLLWSGTLLPTI